jgi:hypothetical protein
MFYMMQFFDKVMFYLISLVSIHLRFFGTYLVAFGSVLEGNRIQQIGFDTLNYREHALMSSMDLLEGALQMENLPEGNGPQQV